ncbi:hypothetical protein YIM_24935 [Amycolatopsis sp. YIM 10]|nr:hypothetical protein YIM_24935 [Amycolatopsis sp. YIM 10]
MEKGRQDRQRITDIFRRRQQGRSHCERGHQRTCVAIVPTSRMPVARQPTNVCQQDRRNRTHPAVGPADQVAGLRGGCEDHGVVRTDLLIGPDIDHNAGAVFRPGEIVRCMPPELPVFKPGQPERLRRERSDLGGEVQQHHLVAFKPRLETDQLPGSSRPPLAGEVALPPVRAEGTNWSRVLEPDVPANGERVLPLLAGRADVPQPETGSWQLCRNCRTPITPPEDHQNADGHCSDHVSGSVRRPRECARSDETAPPSLRQDSTPQHPRRTGEASPASYLT